MRRRTIIASAHINLLFFQSWVVISLNLLVHVIMCKCFTIDKQYNVADVTKITIIMRPPGELKFG